MENPFNQGYYKSEELRRFGFKSIGENVSIAKNCTIIGLENISIGSNVRIDANNIIASNSGYFNLGSYIHIGTSCFFGCSGGITLSDFCGISHGSKIISATDDFSGEWLTGPTIPSQFTSVKIASVFLGKHVVIGAGGIILPGATIGEGTTIGAFSLITKSLDPWGIYTGTPAKFLKPRSKKLLELENQLKSNFPS